MKYQIEQIKLLSDMIWGEEFGRLDWLESNEEWIDIVNQFGSNILTVTRESADYLGNRYQKIVGLLIVAFPKGELVKDEHAIVENEWYLSHSDMWKQTGSVCYLSEIIIHPSFRGGKVLKELMKKFDDWLTEHQIVRFYATGVSIEGCRVIERFPKAEVLKVKTDSRVVYRISMEQENKQKYNKQEGDQYE